MIFMGTIELGWKSFFARLWFWRVLRDIWMRSHKYFCCFCHVYVCCSTCAAREVGVF